MIRRDLPEVLDIEARSFDYPWSDEDFVRVLRERNCIGKVVEDIRTEKIIGYMIYALHASSFQVLNFAVDYDCRRQGVGRILASHLTNQLCSDRRDRVSLMCSEENTDAHLFWHDIGFEAVEVLREPYNYQSGDAYRFEYRIGNESKVLAGG